MPVQSMVPRGLEPRTLRLLAVRSNQLSYETLCDLPQATKSMRETQRLSSDCTNRFEKQTWWGKRVGRVGGRVAKTVGGLVVMAVLPTTGTGCGRMLLHARHAPNWQNT